MLKVVVLVLGLICAISSIQVKSTVPALFWSNTNAFSKSIYELNEIITTQDVEQILTLNTEKFASVVTKTSPQVTLVFLEAKLDTTNFYSVFGGRTKDNVGYIPTLQKIVEGSSSSMIAPYVNITGNFDAELSKQFTRIIVVKQSEDMMTVDGQVVAVEQLSNTVQNGDLVIVYMDAKDIQQTNAIFQGVFNVVSRFQYVAAFTSAEQKSFHFEAVYPQLARMQRDVQSNLGSVSSGYWLDGIVEALIIMIPFIIILFTGLCCTFSVQSELRFEGEKIKKQ
jgi:hypothetical protein